MGLHEFQGIKDGISIKVISPSDLRLYDLLTCVSPR